MGVIAHAIWERIARKAFIQNVPLCSCGEGIEPKRKRRVVRFETALMAFGREIIPQLD